MRRKRKTLSLPRTVAVSADIEYEVVWVDGFADAAVLGECRPDVQQIALHKKLRGPELVKTFIHEVLHAIEDEHQIKISHKAIHQLEDGIFEVLARNGWLPPVLFNTGGGKS